jgi:hypothetical protein
LDALEPFQVKRESVSKLSISSKIHSSVGDLPDLARDSIKNDLALSAAARRSSDKTPVSPGVTMSMGPVAGKAATGRPEAMASSRTMQKVSVRLGKTKTSAEE